MAVESVDVDDMFCEFLEKRQKFGLFFSIHHTTVFNHIENYYDELMKVAGFLKDVDDVQMLADCQGFVTFDTEKEMKEAFDTCLSSKKISQSEENPKMFCEAFTYGPRETEQGVQYTMIDATS